MWILIYKLHIELNLLYYNLVYNFIYRNFHWYFRF